MTETSSFNHPKIIYSLIGTLLTGNTQHAHQPFTPAPMASLPLEDDVRIITTGNQAKLPAEAE